MDITVIQIPTCTSGGRMEELRGGGSTGREREGGEREMVGGRGGEKEEGRREIDRGGEDEGGWRV